MKKHILSIIALVLAVLSLAVSAFSLRTVRDMQAQMDQLIQRMSQSQQAAPTEIPSETAQDSTETTASAECEHYCNLIVSGCTFEDMTLTVSSAFAQVMAGPGVTVSSARTVLTVNGAELYTETLTLHPGEGSDSFELDLDETQYPLPELAEGDHVELLLEAALSDGCALSVCASSWDYEDGQLLMIAG